MRESPVALSFRTTPPTAVSADTQCTSGKSRAEPLGPSGIGSFMYPRGNGWVSPGSWDDDVVNGARAAWVIFAARGQLTPRVTVDRDRATICLPTGLPQDARAADDAQN